MRQQILTGVVIAIVTCLATIVFGLPDTPSRTEVREMVNQSESRTLASINEIKADQKSLLALQQQLLSKQSELSGRIESMRR